MSKPEHEPIDPRDHERVAAFVLDSMPDIAGAVVVTLNAKSRTRAVADLSAYMEAAGATVSTLGRPPPRSPWQLAVSGEDAGQVPWDRRPAANLRRLILASGIPHASHGLLCWPELVATSRELAAMAMSADAEERARANLEITARSKLTSTQVSRRVASAKDTARSRTWRTLDGHHWPTAAKVSAHARVLGVEPESLYARVSYPLLCEFVADGVACVGYVVQARWDNGSNDMIYDWLTMDGREVRTVGMPADLVML